jgi:cytidylate kinase
MTNTDTELRRAAQDRIVERDAASADYLKRFYKVAWEDPLLYHLVINTGKVSLEQAAQIIVMLAKENEAEKPAFAEA